MELSREVKINLGAAAVVAAGAGCLWSASVVLSSHAATVAAVNLGGAVVATVASSIATAGLSSALVGGVMGVTKWVGLTMVSHSSGAAILTGTLGYVSGSMGFIAKLGSLASAATSILSYSVGGHLGTGLAALGVLSAPTWAVPAAVISGGLVVAGVGTVAWQYRDEISAAAATAGDAVSSAVRSGWGVAVTVSRRASKRAKRGLARLIHELAQRFPLEPIDPTESPS
jgi:hypothetical protein